MHDFFSREPDPLDALLAPPSLPPNADVLRRKVFARTQQFFRRRLLARRFALAAALLVSFAAGLLAMRTVKRPAPVPELPTQIAHKDSPRLEERPSPAPEAPALAQEWQAFDSEDHRGELYKQVGDRYMTEESDLQSALRCYGNALDNGTERDRTISTQDTWLLMAIKDARQKENDYAKNRG
jgi:hypothetical protein